MCSGAGNASFEHPFSASRSSRCSRSSCWAPMQRASRRLVLVAGLVLPTLLVLQMRAKPDVAATCPPEKHATKGSTGQPDRGTMLAMLRRISAHAGYGDRMFRPGNRRLGHGRTHQLGCETATDMRDECQPAAPRRLRGDDLVADLGPAQFGVVLHPSSHRAPDDADAIADRLRADWRPVRARGNSLQADRLHRPRCLQRAQVPAARRDPRRRQGPEEAQVAGPGSVRSYVEGSREPNGTHANAADR
jgi:hypothetical protein